MEAASNEWRAPVAFFSSPTPSSSFSSSSSIVGFKTGVAIGSDLCSSDPESDGITAFDLDDFVVPLLPPAVDDEPFALRRRGCLGTVGRSGAVCSAPTMPAELRCLRPCLDSSEVSRNRGWSPETAPDDWWRRECRSEEESS